MSTRATRRPDVRGSLQRLRRGRRGPAVFLALVAYLLTGAAVPQGHMAASLGSGTPFHLCPGDLRSAQILDALATAGGAATAADAAIAAGAEAGGAGGHAHHGHGGHVGHGAQEGHGDTAAVAALADSPVAKSTADPGCAFAAGGTALAASDSTPLTDLDAASPVPLLHVTAPAGRSWLRPPARSPPA